MGKRQRNRQLALNQRKQPNESWEHYSDRTKRDRPVLESKPKPKMGKRGKRMIRL